MTRFYPSWVLFGISKRLEPIQNQRNRLITRQGEITSPRNSVVWSKRDDRCSTWAIITIYVPTNLLESSSNNSAQINLLKSPKIVERSVRENPSLGKSSKGNLIRRQATISVRYKVSKGDSLSIPKDTCHRWKQSVVRAHRSMLRRSIKSSETVVGLEPCPPVSQIGSDGKRTMIAWSRHVS